MLRLTLELCIDGDMNLRDDAHEMLGQLMLLVDECLIGPGDAMVDEDQIGETLLTKDTFQNIME